MIINGLPVVILAIYILHARWLIKKLNEEIQRSDSWRQSALEINAKLHEMEKAKKQADITSNSTEKVA